ncbi:hypothetical protein Dsin_030561 [Dipteronia sinensis]|uniref:RRM domain-containing protein n=1 Tax=Dipteronia sinensis TaxID=43782 RepID=A0AAE0DSJ5_9ROSI|nr:hypothetical protein Dsin_030561 [Dipteronia sinensis]
MVDSACLWGIFKPHGKLRDVFMSSKTNSRMSVYAFIRFESEEEASRVAKRVDGLHVYGWPIRAKLASYGWNKRRLRGERQVEMNVENGFFKNRVNNGSLRQNGHQHYGRQRSFSEVVKGNLHRVEVYVEKIDKKTAGMKWDSYQNSKEWLSKCAIDIEIRDLKSFRVSLGQSESEKAEGSDRKGREIRKKIPGMKEVGRLFRKLRYQRIEGGKRDVNLRLLRIVPMGDNDKGKGLYQRKSKLYPSYHHIVPGKLVIEKRKGLSKVANVDDDSLMSSDTEDGIWSIKNFFERECSLKNVGEPKRGLQLDLLDPEKRPNTFPQDIVNGPIRESSPRLKECAARDFWIDIGPSLGSDISVSKSNNSSGEVQLQSPDGNKNQLSENNKEHNTRNSGFLEVENLSPNQNEEMGNKATAVKKRRGGKKVYSTRKHSMRIRNTKARENQDQEGYCSKGGDFNSVLELSERIGEGNHTGSMMSFESFIYEIKVLDIPLSGMSFTWTNFKEHAVWARLDRFLLSPAILNWFPNLV